MRDSRPTTPRANRIGNMVPYHSGASSGSHGRVCSRCAARLRRDKGMSETLCDPCALIIRPWIQPEPALVATPPRRVDWSIHCHCGARKSAGSAECVTCYRARIAADVRERPWYGPTCACGKAKTVEAHTCRTCRYQGAA